jgi:hypothetical protein
MNTLRMAETVLLLEEPRARTPSKRDMRIFVSFSFPHLVASSSKT